MNYELRTTILLLLTIMLLAVVPLETGAAGLVPCDGPNCQPCHIFALIQNVLNFVWKDLALPLAILMFAIGGFMMVVPGVGGEKSVPMYQKGKKVLTNALIGLAIIFLAWLTIDTIIKAVAGQNIGERKVAEIFGPWNEIKCDLKK